METNFLLNVLIFAAITYGVFGIASLLTNQEVVSPSSTVSVRRSNSAIARYFSRFSSVLLPGKEKDREELRLMLLQADYDSPQSAEAYYGIRVVLSLILLGLVNATLLLVTTIAVQF